MSKFTNFEGDNLDNYLGHEMIEIKDNFPIKIKHQCGLNNVSYLEKTYSSMENDISITEFIKNKKTF